MMLVQIWWCSNWICVFTKRSGYCTAKTALASLIWVSIDSFCQFRGARSTIKPCQYCSKIVIGLVRPT